MIRRAPKTSHVVLLAALGIHCSSSQTTENKTELVGRAQIALTLAPPNARCIDLTVTGSRTVETTFDLTPGQGAILDLDGLPVGMDTFDGLVYPVACNAVTASTTPTWKAVPAVVNVLPDVVNTVNLTLQTNAIATVCLNFEGLDASGDACAPGEAGVVDAKADVVDAKADVVDAGADRDANADADATVDAPRDVVPEAEAAASCPAGQVFCGGACVNPQTNPQFCGATAGCGVDGGTPGVVCATTQACVTGVCISCTTFPSAQQIPVLGQQPTDLVVVDLNGDGRRDIATANTLTNDVSVLLNTGTGTFNAPVRFPAGANPGGIVALELNGDGRLDLVVSNTGPNTLSVLNSTATPGQFSPPVTVSTATGPGGLATGDFNRDGRFDVAAAAQGSNAVATHFGAAPGTLLAGPGAAVGISPRTVTVADVTADGNLDFFVANAGSNSVSVLLGAAGGAFGPMTQIPLGAPAQQVAVGDFNFDGRPDLAIATSQDVRIFFGNGSTTFTPGPMLPPGGASPVSVATLDLDGDLRPDLAVANSASNSVSVFFGTAGGTFQPALNIPLGVTPRMLALGDLNGDGKSDIVTANPNQSNVSVVLAVKPAGCP